MGQYEKTCEYCGCKYYIQEQEHYFEHNGASYTNVVGKCNCNLKEQLESLAGGCGDCEHYISDKGKCSEKNRIDEYKRFNDIDYKVPYVGCVKLGECLRFKPTKQICVKANNIEGIKKCHTCEFKFLNGCTNPERIESVMDKIYELDLPVFYLNLIRQCQEGKCDHHKVGHKYIQTVLTKLKLT